jgi:hypothetical protein
MEETGPRVSRRADRPAEWRSRLAIFTAGILIFLTLSGLAIWLLPFSAFNQVNVLLHTLIALIALAPVGWYCVRHWLFYRRHPLTHIKLLGYLGIGALLVCVVSGLALAYQSLFGIRITYFWRALHDWTTVALIILVIPHVVLIVIRDARARQTEAIAPVWVATKGYSRRMTAVALFALAVTGLAYFAYEPPALMRDFPPDYELWQPRNALYNKNPNFAPSLARTKDNRPIDVKLLAGSQSCGTSDCHEQIVKENALYNNMRVGFRGGQAGKLVFMDVADQYGLGQASLDYVKWGTAFFDYDNDGKPDLFVANGSTFQDEQDKRRLIPMRHLLFWNKSDAEGFFETGAASGSIFQQKTVGRGAAFADYDNDGDVDLCVVNHSEPAWLLRNDGGNQNRWLKVNARGRKNRFGVGAKVKLVIGDKTQMRQIGSQPSYLSGNSLMAHFGVGQAEIVDQVTVVFPGGKTVRQSSVKSNQTIVIEEP